MRRNVCVDMPEWDVSQVEDAHACSWGDRKDITGWTFADNANTTGMFSGADAWLSRASRGDDSRLTCTGAWSFSPRLEDERVELECANAACRTWAQRAGDDPTAGEHGVHVCRFSHAEDRGGVAFAVDPTGVACCSRLSVNCGAAGTTEMADWDVSPVTSMGSCSWQVASTRTSRWDVAGHNMYRMFRSAQGSMDISSGTRQRHDHGADVLGEPRWDVSSVTNMRHMFQNA